MWYIGSIYMYIYSLPYTLTLCFILMDYFILNQQMSTYYTNSVCSRFKVNDIVIICECKVMPIFGNYIINLLYINCLPQITKLYTDWKLSFSHLSKYINYEIKNNSEQYSFGSLYLNVCYLHYYYSNRNDLLLSHLNFSLKLILFHTSAALIS